MSLALPIRFVSFGNTGPLSATKQKRKDCNDQGKQVHGVVLGSFVAPETGVILGDGGGASLVVAYIWALPQLITLQRKRRSFQRRRLEAARSDAVRIWPDFWSSGHTLSVNRGGRRAIV